LTADTRKIGIYGGRFDKRGHVNGKETQCIFSWVNRKMMGVAKGDVGVESGGVGMSRGEVHSIT
jgi:hypothetical protein